MRYVRSRDYPCPEVCEAGEGFLVMDRLEGSTMMDAVSKPPFPLRRSGHLLAELHQRLRHRVSGSHRCLAIACYTPISTRATGSAALIAGRYVSP